MPGVKRPQARITGAQNALAAATDAGAAVRTSRRRRRWTQRTLADKIGISRPYLAKVERGGGAGTSLEVWFALGEALGRTFRAEFATDRLAEPADAGHLAIQELVLRLGRGAGYVGRFGLATRPTDPARSSDVALVDHRRRRLILVECWNTIGDIGGAARSSNRKLAEARDATVVLGGDGDPYAIGLCWVVRDTARNRELTARHEHVFADRFPGSSAAWVGTLTGGGGLPAEPGLIWCDLHAMRLFARRRLSR